MCPCLCVPVSVCVREKRPDRVWGEQATTLSPNSPTAPRSTQTSVQMQTSAGCMSVGAPDLANTGTPFPVLWPSSTQVQAGKEKGGAPPSQDTPEQPSALLGSLGRFSLPFRSSRGGSRDSAREDQRKAGCCGSSPRAESLERPCDLTRNVFLFLFLSLRTTRSPWHSADSLEHARPGREEWKRKQKRRS